VKADADQPLATKEDSPAERIPNNVGRQGPTTDLALLETARSTFIVARAILQEASKSAQGSAVPLRRRPSNAEL